MNRNKKTRASELRLGNIVLYQGEPKKIVGITEEHPYIDDITFDYLDWGEIDPIHLTEEWLVKLGAKEAGIGTNLLEYDRFYLRWHPQYNYWYVTQLVSLEYITKVEFVHEWQNVVFAINGQELEVKL